jgi:cytochrome c-type biogenesis protein CcmH
MLLWLVLALLTAFALFVLLRPLTRKSGAEPPRTAYDLAIYRDQLDEIARDVARGVLGESEAAAARLEIERRLLASQPRGETVAPAPGLSPRALRLAALATMIAVPVLALALYLDLGSPGRPDEPLAARQTERKVLASDGSIDLAKAKVMLEAKLAGAPDSLDGWVLLARTDAALGDWPGARTAFDKVLVLSRRSPEMLEAYGDLLVSEAKGEVTPQAVALLHEAVAAKPDLFRARYYLALAKAQGGDIAGGLANWRALLADAPKDAPWIDTVKNVIAEAEQQLAGDEAAPVPAPAEAQPPAEMAAIMKLPPADRLNAIRGMVAGLAARLEQDPKDLEGWKKLGRSYRVLGETVKSADAFGRAAALDPKDTGLLVSQADALQASLPDDAPIAPAVAELYRKVEALAPDQQQALWYLGLAEKQAGHDDAAAAHWQRLLAQLQPDTPEAKAVQQQLEAVGVKK